MQQFPLSNFKEQLRFAERLGDIFEHVEMVSPLLVKIVIDKFYLDFYKDGIGDFGLLIEKMPKSIADIYMEYLRMLNPVNVKAANFLTTENMYEVAKVLGYHSIKANFKPQDFSKKEVRSALNSQFSDLREIDPIRRFIDNQVITEKLGMAEFFLRFSLDPCAEFLGALYLCDQQADDLAVKAYYDQHIKVLSDEFQGIKFAFEQILAFKGIDTK